MNIKRIYILACLYAIDRLVKNGSSEFISKVNGGYDKVPWIEVCEWLISKMDEVEE